MRQAITINALQGKVLSKQKFLQMMRFSLAPFLDFLRQLPQRSSLRSFSANRCSCRFYVSSPNVPFLCRETFRITTKRKIKIVALRGAEESSQFSKGDAARNSCTLKFSLVLNEFLYFSFLLDVPLMIRRKTS